MFLTYTVHDVEAVKAFLADLPGLTRSVAFRAPADNLLSMVGIGSGLWDRLFPDAKRPAGLHPFEEIRGAKHTAVSTPGDLLIHLRANHADMCFQLATLIGQRLDGHAEVVDETHGFKFFDDRDLLGFVDGSENPEFVAAEDAVLVGDEDPEYPNSSYVIVQKYLHDMDAWNGHSTEQQERAIGRSKLDNVEMSKEEKPANSHIALNDISDEDGNDLKIYRENMPFGSIGDKEFGTYFIGYTKDPGRIERMLRNMFIGNPDHDRILDFSTAHTGGLFFVPTEEFLDSL